ncbi:hypothetical protein TELCIR_15618 [Teladorsagia circumcincta]|uniref:Uncharacterized protein n=1 Tax=Teladorsagia circumcincta TaxID=45464 RepID=A0A2G9TY17_TELCI|nr:hypothetical protein TELCIR_15618 [Teladorsagia circumcincta]
MNKNPFSHQAGPTSKNAFLKKDVIQQLWKGEISVNNRTLAGLGWMRIPGDDYGGSEKASKLLTPVHRCHFGAAAGGPMLRVGCGRLTGNA